MAMNRQKYIGGSDIASIIEISPYKTKFELWAEKKGYYKKKVVDYLQLIFDNGKEMESRIIDRWEASVWSAGTQRNIELKHKEYDFLGGYADAYDEKTNTLIEAKTTKRSFKEMDVDGEDRMPEYYKTQIAWYCMLKDAKDGASAACNGVLVACVNNDLNNLRAYEYVRNSDYEQFLLDSAVKFWQEHIIKDVPPKPKTAADFRLLAEINKENGNRFSGFLKNDNNASLIEELVVIQEEIKALSEKEKEIKNTLFQNNSDGVLLLNGMPAYKISSVKRESFDSKKFKEQHSELYDEFVTTNVFREIRKVKGE